MRDALDLAQHYFDLSNQGRLDEIERLFTPSSTYSSLNTGLHLGAENIIAMQRTFHAGFRSLHWHINSAEEVRPGIVLFDFVMTGTTADGDDVDFSGLEYVIVHQGRLQHVEVRNKP